MILELAEWLWDHWQEVTLNAVLLFILRRFILKELTKLFRFNRNDAVLNNQRIILRQLGVEKEWDAGRPNLNIITVQKSLSGLRGTISRVRIMESFIHRMEIEQFILRRKNMDRLKSKKLWLAILGALIPVINNEFGINLNLDTMIGMWSILGIGIAAIAHVDAKSASAALNAVKVAVTADPNTTYKDMIKTVNIVHGAISSILVDLKKDDGSAAFKAAADAYTQLHDIVNDFRKPDPLPEIPVLPDKQVS